MTGKHQVKAQKEAIKRIKADILRLDKWLIANVSADCDIFIKKLRERDNLRVNLTQEIELLNNAGKRYKSADVVCDTYTLPKGR